jgi:hypothetical protein
MSWHTTVLPWYHTDDTTSPLEKRSHMRLTTPCTLILKKEKTWGAAKSSYKTNRSHFPLSRFEIFSKSSIPTSEVRMPKNYHSWDHPIPFKAINVELSDKRSYLVESTWRDLMYCDYGSESASIRCEGNMILSLPLRRLISTKRRYISLSCK